jgi:hypothetical protein
MLANYDEVNQKDEADDKGRAAVHDAPGPHLEPVGSAVALRT